MDYKIIELNDTQLYDIENRLYEYDNKHITYKISGRIKIGVEIDDKLIAGADACMASYKMLYKIGTRLMKEIEKRAKQMGANMIRLDTFNWQGRDFYRSLGYEEIGFYESKEDGFSEHFFLKRI